MIGGIYFAAAAFATGALGAGGGAGVPGVGGAFHGLAFIADTFHVAIVVDTGAGITIGGVDVKGRVRMQGLVIHDVLNDAPNTCNLVIEGDGPAVGQAIRITLNSGELVLFAGTIQTVDQSFESLPTQVAWAVTAIDDTARANARRPFGTWVDTSATTIAQTLAETYAPAFSTAGIEGGLPPVSIVFDGGDTLIACLARLATAIGGYCKVEDGTIYLFVADLANPPDPIDVAHRFLHSPAIQANIDSSQLRTRVYGKGYGERVPTDVGVGETLLPIQDGAQFPPLGGTAIVGLTSDGAQSEKIAFTGVARTSGGTLVGTGATPTTAPSLVLSAGSGVDNGLHTVSVAFITASGTSLAGPPGSITAGIHPPPETAPAAAAAVNGTGPDQGSHDYAVAFVTSYGETVAGPISNVITTSAAAGQIGAPAAPWPQSNGPHSGAVEFGNHYYAVTFVTAQGETEMGPRVGMTTSTVGNAGNVPPIQGPTVGTTGGNLTPGKRYWYTATFFSPSGESASYGLSPHDVDALLAAGENAISVGGLPYPNGLPEVTGRYIYRHEETFAGSWNGGPFFRVGTINNINATTFLDTMAQGTAATGPGRTLNELLVSTMGPRTIPVLNITTGPPGTTARRLYRSRVTDANPPPNENYFLVATISNNTQTTYDDTKADSALGAQGPTSNTTGTSVQRIPVSGIPIGPASVTARKLYRRFNGAGTFKLVTTIANNTGTTFTDGVANSALGANALTTATAVGNIITATVPIGPAAVIQREIFMSPAGSSVRRSLGRLGENTTTSIGIVTPDSGLTGALEPTADTSGLQQPQGQVNPGASVLPVASSAPFRPTGGWVTLGGGQVVRYTGVSAQTLVGIPPTGPGAITTTVLFGQQAIPSPMLIGVTGLGRGMLKGAGVNIWIQRDDLQAQAEQAARTGGDGVIEFLIVDERRSVDSLAERCDADLALFSRPIVTVSYATRDLKTKSGKTVAVDLASPRIHETLTIQDVTITEIDLARGLAPRFMVRASTVRFSLEDTLRRLVARGPLAGGST